MIKLLKKIASKVGLQQRQPEKPRSVAPPSPPKEIKGNDLERLSLPVPVFPATPPLQLLESERDLVVRLREILGLSIEDTQKYLDPVLLRYAETVHLLPASEIHHHRNIGGLLNHGLEVGYWSGQFSLGYVFEYQGPLRYKRENALLWRFAFILGGMLHDLGKTVSDMVVTDSSGQHIWSPFKESVWEWSERLNLEGYYVYWRKNRVHKRHESVGFPLAHRVIGADVIDLLSNLDDSLIPTLFNFLGGKIDNETPLAKSVLKADSHSTKISLERNGVPINTYLQGSPLDLRIVEIMRELSSKRWTTNQPDSVIWHLPDGLFIHWDKAVEDINRMVAGMGFVGIPKDAGILADTLIDCGVAELYTKKIADTGEVKSYRYHPLLVQGKPEDEKTELEKINKTHDEHYIYALRITDFSYVFNGPCPPVLTTKAVQTVEALQAAKTQTKERKELQFKKSESDSHLTLPTKNDGAVAPVLEEANTEATSQERLDTPPEPTSEEEEPPAPVVQKAPLEFDDLVAKLVAHQGEPPPLETNPSLETNEDPIQEDSTPEPEQESEPEPEQKSEPEPGNKEENSSTKISAEEELVTGLTLPSDNQPIAKAAEMAEKTPDTQKSIGLTLPQGSIEDFTSEIDAVSVIETALSGSQLTLPSSRKKKKSKSRRRNRPQLQPQPESRQESAPKSEPKPLTTLEDWIENYKLKIQEKTQPPITDWLLQITLPVFKQESFLGEDILLIHRELYVCYPHGVNKNNQADEMVSLLAQNKVIVPDNQGDYVHDRDGQKGLKLESSLAALITKTLNAVAELVDPLNHDEPEPQSQEKHDHELEHVPSYFDEIPPIDEDYSPIPENEIMLLNLDAGNSEMYSEPTYAKEEPEQSPIPSQESYEVDDEVEDIEEDPKSSSEENENDDPVDNVPSFSTKAVIQELIDMIQAGEGRWIEEVIKEEDKLVVSDRCLYRIVETYPDHFTIISLKKDLIFANKGISVANGKVFLRIKK